jgi:hypothetical protein
MSDDANPFIKMAQDNVRRDMTDGRAEAEELIARVRSGELTPEDLRGEIEHAARNAFAADHLRGLAYALHAALLSGDGK